MSNRQATLYRMVTPEETCPYGLASLELLKEGGYEVDDKPLRSREEVDAFKARHQVATTPQTFIGDKRIGGLEALQDYLKES